MRFRRKNARRKRHRKKRSEITRSRQEKTTAASLFEQSMTMCICMQYKGFPRIDAAVLCICILFAKLSSGLLYNIVEFLKTESSIGSVLAMIYVLCYGDDGIPSTKNTDLIIWDTTIYITMSSKEAKKNVGNLGTSPNQCILPLTYFFIVFFLHFFGCMHCSNKPTHPTKYVNKKVNFLGIFAGNILVLA